MASLALGLAGAAVGSMFGMPQVGWMIGSTLGGMMESSNLPNIQGPKISDLRVQVSSYGVMRPIYYGTARAAGNVIWSSDLIETATTQSAGGGGKGGPSQDVTTYSYSVNCAVALGEGPITGVRKIWANGILILDASTTNTGITGQSDNVRIYAGDETQIADSLIESYLGAGNVPAYRGTAYVVFENFQLANYGNRLPNFTFEVVQNGSVVAGSTIVMNSDNAYSFMIEHPYRSGVMLALLNKAPSGTGIDELHVLDYVNNTVQVISLGITNAKEIIYVPTTDEIWIATNSWNNSISNYDVALRLAAQTLALIGTVSTAHDGTWGIRSPGHILYDKTYDQVWFLTSTSTVSSGVNVMNPHSYSYVSGGVLAGVSNNLWFTANAIMGTDKLAAGEYGGGIYIFGNQSFIAKIPTLTTNPYPVFYDSLRKRFFFYYNTQTIRVIDELTLATTDFTTTVSNYSTYVDVAMAYHETYDKVFLTEQSAVGVYTLYQLNAATFAVENSWTIFRTNTAPGIVQLKLTPEYVGLIRYDSSTSTSAVLFPIVTRLNSSQVALSSVVTDICARTNLLAADIDVSQLTDMVDGYVISQQSTARNAIENLMTVYYFDAVESQP